MEVTKVENVSRIYKIGKIEMQALRGVSLSIENGEFTALVGPSGSGKTTLLQLIGVLDQPTGGKVFINGNDVSRLKKNQRADIRRGTIGFIFQFFALIPTLTAYENVELPLLLSHAKPAERRARVDELLKAVDLSDRAHHRPDQLSGGEQQRVAVARALATRPTLILADEPTANVDTGMSRQIVSRLRALADNGEHGVLLATHDLRMASQADRVLSMRDGRIVKETVMQPGRSGRQVLAELA